MENLNNFARPEAELAFAHPMFEFEEGQNCEECGKPCLATFCSSACEAEAQMDAADRFRDEEDNTIWIDEPEDDIDSPLPHETETPEEYREWLDDFEPYDYWE